MIKWLKRVFSRKKKDPNNPVNWDRKIVVIDISEGPVIHNGMHPPKLLFNDIPLSEEDRKAMLKMYQEAKPSLFCERYGKRYFCGVAPIHFGEEESKEVGVNRLKITKGLYSKEHAERILNIKKDDTDIPETDRE